MVYTDGHCSMIQSCLPLVHPTVLHAHLHIAQCSIKLLYQTGSSSQFSTIVARRGSRDASKLIQELCTAADAVRGSMSAHMAHEESELLPLLEAHLCVAEQRAMLWRTLRGMPLRLLEKVMPWVAGQHI